MNARSLLAYPLSALLLVLAACGGSADAPPPPGSTPVVPVVPVPPTITQQPADVTVTVGQTASFTVAATGDATITYQWQKNGTAIAGATAATYTTPATVLGDSGSTYRAVATNGAGSATSNNATLTVTASAPVLTITPQPASTTVAAGAAASFTVGGTCSSGTLNIQWQRFIGSAFTDIAGATSATYTIASAASSDNGAQFRAVLDCSGQTSTPSSVATLTVTSPTAITLGLYPLVGLREQANVGFSYAVDQLPDGSWALSAGDKIQRIAADLLSITPIAGGGTGAITDGVGTAARFNHVAGVTHDSAGNLFAVDSIGFGAVRRISADGTVTTIAGSLTATGSADGTGSAARFFFPSGIALGPDGDLYVADTGNQTIRRVTTAGVVTTYAGVAGSSGYADGVATTSRFNAPTALAFTPNGDLYVADTSNHRIRKIARSGTVAGAVSTFAGSGDGSTPPVDGTSTVAGIPAPMSLLLRGNALYVGDGANLIRQVDLTTGAVTTFTGSRSTPPANVLRADGAPGTARFVIAGNNSGIAVGPAGGLLIADYSAVRVASAAGYVTTIASVSGNGTGVLAQLPLSPPYVTVDPLGGVVVDGGNSVRRVDPSGNVTSIAGLPGSGGTLDGVGSEAQFGGEGALASATDGTLYVLGGTLIRRIGTDHRVTTIAGAGTGGAVDGPGATARFGPLTGVAVGPTGAVFVADPNNAAIRRVDATLVVTTAVGALGQSSAVDGPIGTARLVRPTAVAFAPDGTLWIADNGVLRRVSADGQTVSTPAGTPSGAGPIAVGPDGIVYALASAGLVAYDPSTATSSALVPYTGFLNLGSGNATLRTESSIAVLGPKQIVIGESIYLLLVTLP